MIWFDFSDVLLHLLMLRRLLVFSIDFARSILLKEFCAVSVRLVAMLPCLLAIACTDLRPCMEWLVTEALGLVLCVEAKEWEMAQADRLLLALSCFGETFFF